MFYSLYKAKKKHLEKVITYKVLVGVIAICVWRTVCAICVWILHDVL